MAELRFTKHFDTLIALVTHLSSTHYKSRTPAHIAKALGLDAKEVLEVLQRFPGFFRRSRNQTQTAIISTPFTCVIPVVYKRVRHSLFHLTNCHHCLV